MRSSLPVHVANDANTAALGEFTFGDAGEHGLMLVRVGKGVGAGLLLEGTLLAGQHLAAGEIGHMTIDERGDAVRLRAHRLPRDRSCPPPRCGTPWRAWTTPARARC